MKRGFDKLKEIFWYSDSEPNEVLIAFCHIIALPASLLVEFDNPSLLFILGSLGAGAFQLWAVLWCGQLSMRLLAVQIATLIAIMTIINLSIAGLMSGSRVGWIIIGGFAVWNTIRVFNEKIAKDGW